MLSWYINYTYSIQSSKKKIKMRVKLDEIIVVMLIIKYYNMRN